MCGRVLLNLYSAEYRQYTVWKGEVDYLNSQFAICHNVPWNTDSNPAAAVSWQLASRPADLRNCANSNIYLIYSLACYMQSWLCLLAAGDWFQAETKAACLHPAILLRNLLVAWSHFVIMLIITEFTVARHKFRSDVLCMNVKPKLEKRWNVRTCKNRRRKKSQTETE